MSAYTVSQNKRVMPPTVKHLTDQQEAICPFMALQQLSSENENGHAKDINTCAHFFARNERHYEETFEENYE